MQPRQNTFHFITVLIAVLVLSSSALHSQTAISSGEWADPSIWDTYMIPTDNEPALIPDGYTVTKTDLATFFARVKAGSNAAGGTLIISAGRINASNSMIGAHEIALEPHSTGEIHVNRGHLSTTSSNGGGIRVGVGEYSTGHLRITSGTIETTSGIHLGTGANAVGKMTVSGGIVTVATGTGPNINTNINANFFVGGLVRSVHQREGIFEQTGGSFTVTDGHGGAHFYFSVGNAHQEQNNPVGSATLGGGTFTANVKVGRDNDLSFSDGRGLLTIGSEANVKGQSQAWEVSANGTLEFQLGSDESFNPVDLTMVTVPEAIIFSQSGAKLQVDGANLPYSSLYRPITLMEFKSGNGPSAASLSNLTVDFVGFDSRFSPRVEWTDTALIVRVVR